MGLSLYNIKNWSKMLTGKSILHVNQGIGRIYSDIDVKGYYNDLTEKVTKDPNFEKVEVPKLELEDRSKIYFPISIFQYGLGSYDLFLLKEENIYLEKFKICVEWAYENQEANGSWNTFYFKDKKNPYSSMAQGEGISLLIRAYKEFNDKKYLIAAKKAIYFMIKPIEDGGTTEYKNGNIFLKEYTNKPTVLNGWIFSIFGIYDYLKVVDDIEIRHIYNETITTLKNHMKYFDNGYWSKYDMGLMITSPFYHKLHIAQLEVMYKITGESIFKDYSKKWRNYQSRKLNCIKAFYIKSFQKIFNV